MKEISRVFVPSLLGGLIVVGLWTGPAQAAKGGAPACQVELAQCLAQPACGDGVVEGTEACDLGNLNGATCVTQGFAGGTLTCGTGCTFDTSDCYAIRFVDNGDGTVTDHQTRLMWEKKDSADRVANYNNPHDVNNVYPWSAYKDEGSSIPDGGAFADFLARLNNCVSSDGRTLSGGFAGQCDWRLPQIGELRSIINCSYSTCLDPIFGPTATSGFTFYWSATTDANQPLGAWGVNFNDHGFFSPALAKANAFIRVRAVRSIP